MLIFCQSRNRAIPLQPYWIVPAVGCSEIGCSYLSCYVHTSNNKIYSRPSILPPILSSKFLQILECTSYCPKNTGNLFNICCTPQHLEIHSKLLYTLTNLTVDIYFILVPLKLLCHLLWCAQCLFCKLLINNGNYLIITYYLHVFIGLELDQVFLRISCKIVMRFTVLVSCT